METPITDKLQRDINEWYEGEGRESEKLDEVFAQLRAKERDADLKSRGEKYEAIGRLHRPSGRLTGDAQVQFLQDVFSIPLPVHGTLRVYRKEGENAE
jgi:hypothetical protein